MSKNLLITIALIAGISFSKSAFCTTQKTAGDTTYIYVYRVGQFSGAGANWAVFVDNEKKCKLSNNKYMRIIVAPGKHKISAKVGGANLFKKETEIEIDAEAGGSYYVACNVKQSITRTRLEMIEVTKSSAAKQMEKMALDNCQESLDQ